MSGLASATLITNNTEINISNVNLNYLVNRTFAFENITANDNTLFIDNMTFNYTYSNLGEYNNDTGNITNYWNFDINDTDIEGWKDKFKDYQEYLCIDGGKTTWGQKTYESMLTPSKDDYGRRY